MSGMSLSTDKDVYFWHFQVPENGTSSAQIQNLKLLFHAKGWNAGPEAPKIQALPKLGLPL